MAQSPCHIPPLSGIQSPKSDRLLGFVDSAGKPFRHGGAYRQPFRQGGADPVITSVALRRNCPRGTFSSESGRTRGFMKIVGKAATTLPAAAFVKVSKPVTVAADCGAARSGAAARCRRRALASDRRRDSKRIPGRHVRGCVWIRYQARGDIPVAASRASLSADNSVVSKST